MQLSVSGKIHASAQKVWDVISDIENYADTISGIDKIEIIQAGGDELVGLKWKETRKFGGKVSEETMSITDAKKPLYYNTTTEKKGVAYSSRWTIHEHKNHCDLGIEFTATPTSLGAKIVHSLLGGKIRKMISTSLRKDLQDIKAAAEQK